MPYEKGTQQSALGAPRPGAGAAGVEAARGPVGPYASGKRTAPTGNALDMNFSLKQLDKLARNRQTQSEAFLPLCAAQAGKLLKDALLLFLSHSASRVDDTKLESPVLKTERKDNTPG